MRFDMRADRYDKLVVGRMLRMNHPITVMYDNTNTNAPLIAALQNVFSGKIVYGGAVEPVGVPVWASL